MPNVDTTVYVDPSDVLDELSTSELEKELRRRKKADTLSLDEDRAELERVLAYLQSGDANEAALLLDRLLNPRFTSFDAAMAAYAKARLA